MTISAIRSPNPLDEAREGMVANLKPVIADSDCLAAGAVCPRPAPDYFADIIDSIDPRGGRSQ